MIRPYIEKETHDRVLAYAANMGIKLHTKSGITEVYTQLINGLLDEKGNAKDRLVLTDGQVKIIQDIATGMDESPDKMVQELINYALLIFTSHISLREVIVTASPLIMDELVANNQVVAKEILKGLKQTKKEAGELNPQVD